MPPSRSGACSDASETGASSFAMCPLVKLLEGTHGPSSSAPSMPLVMKSDQFYQTVRTAVGPWRNLQSLPDHEIYIGRPGRNDQVLESTATSALDGRGPWPYRRFANTNGIRTDAPMGAVLVASTIMRVSAPPTRTSLHRVGTQGMRPAAGSPHFPPICPLTNRTPSSEATSVE